MYVCVCAYVCVCVYVRVQMKSKKLSRSSKSNVDNLKLNLDTQVRVAEVLEQERDRAFDDFEMAQVSTRVVGGGGGGGEGQRLQVWG